MPTPIDFVINMIQKNPAIANNPQAQNYINVLKSRDASKGEEIAKNLCETYGVSPEEGLNQAKTFFNKNMPFGW